ncbi:MAG: hypothetical protein ISS49_16230 [Anaerolineae bacterium]|nr:hypothetical protein [Anaerolineae bacterium]
MSNITVQVLSDGSLVLPATMKKKFAHVETFQVTRQDGSIMLTPQERAIERETLADYLECLQTDNLLADIHKAKEKSHALFQDQGLATISMAVADVLVGLLTKEYLLPPAELDVLLAKQVRMA